MFLDIQHVYLHQRLLIWQIQVCTIYTSSHVETTTSGMYHVYVIICLNDNFRYVPCLRHHLLKGQLQICTMSTSLFDDITARMVDKYVLVCLYDMRI